MNRFEAWREKIITGSVAWIDRRSIWLKPGLWLLWCTIAMVAILIPFAIVLLPMFILTYFELRWGIVAYLGLVAYLILVLIGYLCKQDKKDRGGDWL